MKNLTYAHRHKTHTLSHKSFLPTFFWSDVIFHKKGLFKRVPFAKYNYTDQVKEDGMGWACSTHGDAECI
jgi:hypothetical protein